MAPTPAAESQAVARWPRAFTASETFDIGVDLGLPVAPDCCHCALFPFTGTIHWAHITDT
jgi:hypothetical protein